MVHPDEVHLWLAELSGPGAEPLAGAWDLLDAEERARAERFIIDRPRVEYVLSHALVRRMLAALTGADPRDFRFRARDLGKPEIAAPAEHAALRFNLSHTRGLAACAAALGREVGVDVEYARERTMMVEVAERVFCAAELEAFLRVPDADKKEVFFARWTLKEAIMKARGEGFHLSPERLDFPLQPGGSTKVVSATLDGVDLLEDWQFYRFQPSPDHAGALAVELRGGPARIVQREKDTPPA